MLDMILDKLSWNPYGIVCPDSATAKKVHKFLREAILDSHVYITKVVGFSVSESNNAKTNSGNMIARHSNVGESYPEIMTNLSDKIFLDTQEDTYVMKLHQGLNTLNDNSFEGKLFDPTAKVLYSKPDICCCLSKETMFELKLKYDCGYSSMATNSALIDGEYFPCYTYFTLEPYVRILPMLPGATVVPVRYYNGCT